MEVAQQLKKFVGSRGIVARLGGDEVVIVLTVEAARDAIASAADAMLRELTAPLCPRAIERSASIRSLSWELSRCNSYAAGGALSGTRWGGARSMRSSESRSSYLKPWDE